MNCKSVTTPFVVSKKLSVHNGEPLGTEKLYEIQKYCWSTAIFNAYTTRFGFLCQQGLLVLTVTSPPLEMTVSPNQDHYRVPLMK
jgi:hypothetical protein